LLGLFINNHKNVANIVKSQQLFVNLPSDLNDFMNIEPILHKKTFQELTTDELYELLRVRSEVFVVEQNCVYQDMDGDDQKSIHLWLTIAGKIVALARVCPAGTHMKEISIGRVITTERGKGYGKQIMLRAIDAAIELFSATLIDIEAQEYARGFYESVGFTQSSDTLMLDGIPHIKMTWTKENYEKSKQRTE
jgi:ElaA protein